MLGSDDYTVKIWMTKKLIENKQLKNLGLYF